MKKTCFRQSAVENLNRCFKTPCAILAASTGRERDRRSRHDWRRWRRPPRGPTGVCRASQPTRRNWPYCCTGRTAMSAIPIAGMGCRACRVSGRTACVSRRSTRRSRARPGVCRRFLPSGCVFMPVCDLSCCPSASATATSTTGASNLRPESRATRARGAAVPGDRAQPGNG